MNMVHFVATKIQKISKTVCQLSIGVSYVSLCKLLRQKSVKVNGKRIKDDVTLQKGDMVEIYCEPKIIEKFSTVFSDDNIVVIDKKSGFTSEEVFDTLKSIFPTAKFVHRLDRNTDGIMIFALNSDAERELLKGFKGHEFEKYYFAEVIGKMPKNKDILSGYLIKNSGNATVKVYNEKVNGSVFIKTGYEVQQELSETSILRVTLFTGKTHQIRAHFAHIGHPIVGDGKYGDNAFNKKIGAKTQRLSAKEIILHFPKDSKFFYLNGKIFKTE